MVKTRRIFNQAQTASLIAVLFTAPPLSAGPSVRTLRAMKPDLAVVSVAFSPDGKTLVTGGVGRVTVLREAREEVLKYHTGGLQFWDAATGTLKKTVTLRDLPVLCVAVSPDGKTVATANEKEIRLWDFQTYRLKRVLHTGATQLVFSLDGKFVASGRDERHQTSLRLWDARTGKLHQTLAHRNGEFWGDSSEVTVNFLPDGKTVAVTNSIATRLWDTTTGKLEKVVEDTGQPLVFSADGKTVVALNTQVIGPNYGVDQVTLLNARTWKLQQEMTSVDSSNIENATAIAISPDSKTLVAGVQAQGQEVRFWDLSTKKLQHTVKGGNSGNFTNSLAYSLDGKLLARGAGEGVTIWQIVP